MTNNNWTVQRSGAGLSIAITDGHGRVQRKLTAVDQIKADKDGTIMAYFRNGDTHVLRQPT